MNEYWHTRYVCYIISTDGGGSGSGSNSRPISDQIDLVSENSTSQKEKDGLKSESKRSVEEEETNDENTSTTAILTPLKSMTFQIMYLNHVSSYMLVLSFMELKLYSNAIPFI